MIVKRFYIKPVLAPFDEIRTLFSSKLESQMQIYHIYVAFFLKIDKNDI